MDNKKYIETFLKRRSSLDLLPFFLTAHKVGKEITESMACLHAALSTHLDPQNKEVNVLVIGDGGLPRTGALFAFNTAWNVFSLDPQLNMEHFINIVNSFKERKVERLHVAAMPMKSLCLWNIPPKEALVIVRPHSHCDYKEMLSTLKDNKLGAKEIILIDLPCCVKIPHFFLTEKVVRETEMLHYKDHNVWSPQNSVYIYRHFHRAFDFLVKEN